MKTIFIRFMVVAAGLEVTMAKAVCNRARLKQARIDLRHWQDALDRHLDELFINSL